MIARYAQMTARHAQMTARHTQMTARHAQIIAGYAQIIARHAQMTAAHAQIIAGHAQKTTDCTDHLYRRHSPLTALRNALVVAEAINCVHNQNKQKTATISALEPCLALTHRMV